jgi:hypothetical protein
MGSFNIDTKDDGGGKLGWNLGSCVGRKKSGCVVSSASSQASEPSRKNVALSPSYTVEWKPARSHQVLAKRWCVSNCYKTMKERTRRPKAKEKAQNNRCTSTPQKTCQKIAQSSIHFFVICILGPIGNLDINMREF